MKVWNFFGWIMNHSFVHVLCVSLGFLGVRLPELCPLGWKHLVCVQRDWLAQGWSCTIPDTGSWKTHHRIQPATLQPAKLQPGHLRPIRSKLRRNRRLWPIRLQPGGELHLKWVNVLLTAHHFTFQSHTQANRRGGGQFHGQRVRIRYYQILLF